MSVKVVVGISDWPETQGEHFDICKVKPHESDTEAIARAKLNYEPSLECVIEER